MNHALVRAIRFAARTMITITEGQQIAEEIERQFVVIPREEYTAEVEAARIKAIGEMEHP